MRKYKYNKMAGAVQDNYDEDIGSFGNAEVISQMASSAPMPLPSFQQNALDVLEAHAVLPQQFLGNVAHGTAQAEGARHRRVAPVMMRGGGGDAPAGAQGLDRTTPMYTRHSMFFYTVEDGQRVLVIERNGRMNVVDGPARVWRWRRKVRQMQHHVAHPGDFLIVRHRDGRQEHLAGPAHVWFDPREHLEITREEALPIAAKEAVVVYTEDPATGDVTRRIAHGPATFVPSPGEWLHTFSWHGSRANPDGSLRKVPNALVFQKLWLMPDQMYHDVNDVRTADDALLTIRLMLFFELVDIEKMLATSHDPIGDFINAATSDVVEFMSRHDFESFKHNTEKLNDLKTYHQLAGRAEQCGYKLGKVVYRGYGAPERLQKMHDQAIESRTRLALERATEQQAQELEDFKLERLMLRQGAQRRDDAESIEHDLEIARKRREEDLVAGRERRDFERREAQADQEVARARLEDERQAKVAYYQSLADLGVDMTSYMTKGQADQVIEVRGGGTPHVHIERD